MAATAPASKGWSARLSPALRPRMTKAGRRNSGSFCKSYMRFYSFIAQVIRLEDTGLEKLYS